MCLNGLWMFATVSGKEIVTAGEVIVLQLFVLILWNQFGKLRAATIGTTEELIELLIEADQVFT